MPTESYILPVIYLFEYWRLQRKVICLFPSLSYGIPLYFSYADRCLPLLVCWISKIGYTKDLHTIHGLNGVIGKLPCSFQQLDMHGSKAKPARFSNLSLHRILSSNRILASTRPRGLSNSHILTYHCCRKRLRQSNLFCF